mgnify:CR=1 FL=1
MDTPLCWGLCCNLSINLYDRSLMKYVLLFFVFGTTPVVVQQEFLSARACQDAKTIMNLGMPNHYPKYGFCLPLE